MLYMIYSLATFRPTRFDPVTQQEVPVIMLLQSEGTIGEALKGRGLTEMARNKIQKSLDFLEAEAFFASNEISAVLASQFVEKDFFDRNIEDLGDSFITLE